MQDDPSMLGEVGGVIVDAAAKELGKRGAGFSIERIKAALDRVFQSFTGRGQLPTSESKLSGILVIGCGGVGKSTLGKMLAGETDWLAKEKAKYEESHNLEVFPLADDKNVGIIVPPGQEHRRDPTWNDIEADIASGRFRGIIMVVASGYHNVLGSYQAHELYKNLKGKGRVAAFLKQYLEMKCAEELAVLKRIGHFVISCPGRLWLLTLVTKQDLWSRKQADVERHYTTGDYRAQLSSICDARRPGSIRHEFAYVSLVISNFASSGKVLCKTTAGYDHPTQIASLVRFFEIFAALREWEKDNG